MTDKHFCSVDEYQSFLSKLLKQISKDEEYVVFCHQIGNQRSFFYNSEEEKLSGILNNRFSIHPYPTICGTACCMGEANDPTSAKKVVEYDYYNLKNNRKTLIFVVPKHITVKGKKVEFSSYLGGDATILQDKSSPLALQYIKQLKDIPLKPYTKYCLMDVVFERLPCSFTLGFQQINADNSVDFKLNNTHLSLLEKPLQAKHSTELEKLVIEKFKEFNSTNLEDLIVKSYDKFDRERSISADDFD